MNEEIKTPRGELARMQAVRLGKITFKLQFVAVAFALFGALSVVASVLFYVLLILIVLVTLGSIFVIYPEFSSLFSGSEQMMNAVTALVNGWGVAAGIAIALAAISTACLCFDKRKKHVALIATNVAVIVASVIYIIIKSVVKA